MDEVATRPDLKPFVLKSSGMVGRNFFSASTAKYRLIVLTPVAHAVADAAESVYRLSAE